MIANIGQDMTQDVNTIRILGLRDVFILKNQNAPKQETVAKNVRKIHCHGFGSVKSENVNVRNVMNIQNVNKFVPKVMNSNVVGMAIASVLVVLQ